MSGVRARRSSGKHALRPIGLAKYTLDRERVDVDEARAAIDADPTWPFGVCRQYADRIAICCSVVVVEDGVAFLEG